MTATIAGTRDGTSVTVSYTAPARYDNLWIELAAGSYAAWAQVRYGQLDEPAHTFTGAPAGVTATLRSPAMRGGRRVWRSLAETFIP